MRRQPQLPDHVPVSYLHISPFETKIAAGPRAYVQVVRGADAGCQKTAVWEADRKYVFGVSDQRVS